MSDPKAGLAPPEWRPPSPYGYPSAVDNAGTVAAPLFAGFAVTLIGQILVQSDQVRWVDAALMVLCVAVVLMGAAVQFAFHARAVRVDAVELESWWPDHDQPPRREWLRDEQRRYFNQHAHAAQRFRRAYNAGIFALLAGVALALVPEGTVAPMRALAIGILGAAALVELWLVVQNWSRSLGAPSADHLSPRREASRRSSG